MRHDLYQAVLRGYQQLTHDVREFTFGVPHALRWQAGQYIEIAIPAMGSEQPNVTRAYSVCSPPSQTTQVSIVANHVPGGRGSTYLFGLEKDAQVSMHGPKGHFVVDARGTRDYLFIGTGTGIGPLRAMIAHVFELRTPRTVHLLWGLRHQRDLYYQEEWATLAQQHDHFSYTITLSQPDAGWHGTTGRVTTYIEREVHDVRALDVYVCGSDGMIQEVKSAVRTKGLCPVHTEKFY